ncbi:phosphotransferase [Limibaculum sp. FT325]|uniref:aminoglycoside phosphotransferase family protein n=1 Tax=Thermohalobaculum sediminis TaxID=2939436 RepID=UPI0020C0A40C|nr:phosphotransferase [Limibaculum sediminis]MCL5776479.1 phosphotransferase [Limibaculum sediminis]
MSAARAEALSRFLRAAGAGGAVPRPLAGDASNRRYLRLDLPSGRPAVVMDAPPERGEDVRPFVAVTRWLRGLGLAAPEILAADEAGGFLLLEDLGDDLYARVCAGDPGAEAPLYEAAVDLLATLADHPAPARMGDRPLPPYDAAVLWREAALAMEWWLPAVTGAPASPDAVAELRALLAAATAPVEPARDVVVLRDYHAENLIWLPDRAGDARVGLLDYQDALAGHAAYDLVSLLEDARRDTSAELRAAMVARYLDRRGLGSGDARAFRTAYAALGAQRNLKIVGIFARLAIRDGKPRYLGLIPRVWDHLARDLAHPDFAALAGFVARHIPAPAADALARAEAAARGPLAAAP